MRTNLTFIGAVLLISALVFAPLGLSARAQDGPSEEEIQASIDLGLGWLVNIQQPNGSFGGYESVAYPCFALVKLEERAYELGYDSPFDPAYPYSANVIAGWQYVFNPAFTNKVLISPQLHGAVSDNPDTNGNGYGVAFSSYSLHPTYTTGICLMALAASGTSDHPNDGSLDFNGNGGADTFKELAQEAVDWLAFGQGDFDWCEGGWGYDANDNSCWWADNSVGGYAVLGLAYGKDFGVTVPDWVSTELEKWINFVQCQDGGFEDGSSGYNWPCNWGNELKTGNLIFQMTYLGDDPSTPRFQDAIDYIERRWFDTNRGTVLVCERISPGARVGCGNCS